MSMSDDGALLRDETLIVLENGWDSLSVDTARQLFERDVLPRFLAGRRWFAGSKAGSGLSLEAAVPFQGSSAEPVLLTLIKSVALDGAEQTYFLPLAVSLVEPGGREEARFAADALSRVTWNGRGGIIYDALADDGFVADLATAMGRGETRPGLAFASTSAFARAMPGAAVPLVRRPAVDHSNTTVRLGDQAILKAYRKVAPGPHPELEVGRFLTEEARYPNTPPLLGSLELVGADGERTMLCLLHGYVANQGDGWSCAIEFLTRATAAGDLERFSHLSLMRRLGQRAGELHQAFAISTRDQAFAAEPVSEDELYAWQESVREAAGSVLRGLRQVRSDLPEAARSAAVALLRRDRDLMDRIATLVPERLDAFKTRYHGDFHLGQVLVVGSDVHIIDFEGEPMRPLAFRRAKHSPLRDVAGMLRSFDYAAAAVRHSRGAGGPRPGESSLGQWQLSAGAAFLGGWCDAVVNCPSVPSDTRAMESLLDLFLLEKSLYEVAYELAHRPDWLAIPLAGVQALLGDRL